MADVNSELNLIEILAELSEVPFHTDDLPTALHEIAELGRRALGSRVCTITFVNAEGGRVEQVACAGVAEIEAHWGHKTISFPAHPSENRFDFDLVAKGEPIEKYGLQEDGQGVANPATAKKYNLKGMLSQPLWFERKLLGYLNHFSSSADRFTTTEKRLIAIFARQAVISIEKLEQESARVHTLTVFNDVLRSLESLAPGQFLQRVAEGVRQMLGVTSCIVWELDDAGRILRVAATTPDVGEDYRSFVLDPTHPKLARRLLRQEAVEIEDVRASDALYVGQTEAVNQGWVSLLTVPIFVDHQLSGMLDAYTREVRHFKTWEREAFALFANQTALSLHSLEKRIEELNGIVQEIAQSRDEDSLFTTTLTKALKIVGCHRGWISKLDVRSGDLTIVAKEGDPTVRKPLKLGKGITGRALVDEKPYRVDDVRSNRDYEEFWPDTRSELAVPLIIQNAEVRVRREVQYGSKRVGVLNVESRVPGAFFNLDEDCLVTIARAAATTWERLETDRKFASLTRVETEILDKGHFHATIEHILKTIIETLGYQFVNISLVEQDESRIKSAYVEGLSKEQKKKFLELADHPLDGDKPDIQADVVKTRATEVPDLDDPRFDPEIYAQFGHKDLIRVFVPMISRSTNQVVGTVEAGYERALRPFIYERDVNILTDFVNFVSVALEQSRVEVLAKIMHEFRAPAAAMRSDVSYLKRKFEVLSGRKINIKLDDLLLDAELVLLQVSKVEHFFGGVQRPSTFQRTVVYRDIIIKTINQLKPRIIASGFDASKVQYNVDDIGKMVLYIDPVKLSQVVFNILINSIKYAERDPSKFVIRVDLDETRDYFTVKFRDWGMGIKKEFEERIFEQGFRAPEATAMFVTGSGLGLTIAREFMRELGGDLRLANNFKPTEFHVVLPKTLKEPPK